MDIRKIEWSVAKAALHSFLPEVKNFLPSDIADAAKAAGFQIKLFRISDPEQVRSDESLLSEFIHHAGRYIRGQCIVVPDEAFDKAEAPYIMDASDFTDFVDSFPHIVFDGDLIIICKDSSVIVGYQFEGTYSVIFVAIPGNAIDEKFGKERE